MAETKGAMSTDRSDDDTFIIKVAETCKFEELAHFEMDAYIKEVHEEVSCILKQNEALASDDTNKGHLSSVAPILAVYRIGTRLTGKGEEILDAIQNVKESFLLQRVEPYIERRFGIDFSQPGESFNRVVMNFIQRGRDIFGNGYTYELDEHDENRYFVNISRCFFHDFFNRNDAPEVTRVMCALDMVWARVLDERGHNVHFKRPAKMADGDDVCRFHFYRQ